MKILAVGQIMTNKQYLIKNPSKNSVEKERYFNRTSVTMKKKS